MTVTSKIGLVVKTTRIDITERQPKVQHVRSADRTQIASDKTGEGPPLIITGGALGDR
jgi:hypothetical protein